MEPKTLESATPTTTGSGRARESNARSLSQRLRGCFVIHPGAAGFDAGREGQNSCLHSKKLDFFIIKEYYSQQYKEALLYIWKTEYYKIVLKW